MDRHHALILVLGVACVPAEEDPAAHGATLATELVAAPGDEGVGTTDAQRAINGVRGAGRWQGGLDVFSMETELVLGFFGDAVVDREGPDLAIFENAFDIQGGGRFMDPVVVELSADCVDYVAFPHSYTGDPAFASSDPADWHGFAGIGAVELHEEDHPVDPLDPEAGGDRFDLADVDLDEVRCIRLSSAVDWGFPAAPSATGPDIDGVYARDVR